MQSEQELNYEAHFQILREEVKQTIRLLHESNKLIQRRGLDRELFDLVWTDTGERRQPPVGTKQPPPWKWREDPPLPVVFDAPERISAPVVHLHLEHPFVQRMLQRFRSQGFAANDLSRGCSAEDVTQMIAVTVLQAQTA